MDWTQALLIFVGNIVLFLRITRQARADFLHTCRIIEIIQGETKDFHERLCILENRMKK